MKTQKKTQKHKQVTYGGYLYFTIRIAHSPRLLYLPNFTQITYVCLIAHVMQPVLCLWNSNTSL